MSSAFPLPHACCACGTVLAPKPEEPGEFSALLPIMVGLVPHLTWICTTCVRTANAVAAHAHGREAAAALVERALDTVPSPLEDA